MTIKRHLTAFIRVVSEEAERNHEFRAAVEEALGLTEPTAHGKSDKGGRRDRSLVDPIAVFHEEGEARLRAALASMGIEQLKDVIAQFGMDHDRLALKWKDRTKLEARIVEVSRSRASKGSAFRDE